MNQTFLKLYFKKVLNFLNNSKTILAFWLLLVVIITCKQYFLHSFNNYLIFKHTFYHALHGLDLYAAYPGEYNDTNHYGPFFSLLIAPFALLPDLAGMLLWQVANVLFLFFAVKQLPLGQSKINAVYWIITHELVTAMLGFQFNISITAIIIAAYVLVNRNQNFWAAFVIMLGAFVKIYGLAGLAFFFFAKQKPKFVLYCIIWAWILFILPMFLFSTDYVLVSYKDWYLSLTEKQLLNESVHSAQDISVMGMVRRITGIIHIRDIYFIAAGALLFCMPYLRVKEYKSTAFQLHYLAAALIFVVIFSNSSESPTYIIAFTGVATWFVLQQRPLSPLTIALFVFALLLTSFSPSDLFPKFIKEEYIKPYSLKALPCVLVWLVLTWQLLTRKFYLNPVDA